MDQVAKGITGIDYLKQVHIYEFDDVIEEREIKVLDKSVKIKNIYFPQIYWQKLGVCSQKDLEEFRNQMI